MAQSHSVVPWMANQVAVNPLTQHIQGVLAHGRKACFYRTFHNVSNGANLQIHTLLLTLESIKKEKGRLPPTLYLQIDGGSENTAKVVMYFCELLVASGVFRKVVATRLMVGHTHCDIDALFGRIWLHNRVRLLSYSFNLQTASVIHLLMLYS